MTTGLEAMLRGAAGVPEEVDRFAYSDWLEEQGRPGWESSWWRTPWVPSEGGHTRINVNRGDGISYGYDETGMKFMAYGITEEDCSGDGIDYGYGMGDSMGHGKGDNDYWAGGAWKWSYQVEVRRNTQEG